MADPAVSSLRPTTDAANVHGTFGSGARRRLRRVYFWEWLLSFPAEEGIWALLSENRVRLLPASGVLARHLLAYRAIKYDPASAGV